MKKLNNYLILFILMAVAAAGCSKKPDTSQIIASVNDYKITADDFRQEAKMSMTGISKEQILQNIITKELLLQEAQKRNLDKDRYFMIDIENYWKQALIKRLISIKGNEFLVIAKGKGETKMKNAQAMLENWINNLNSKAIIKNYDTTLNGIKFKKTGNQDGGINADSSTCTP